MTLGENIRRLRKEKGYTQKHLAEKCEMYESQIRKYELGKANPKIETIQKIATALDVPISNLLESWRNYFSDTPNDVSEDKPISFPLLEKRAEGIGYHIHYGTYDNSDGIELIPGEVFINYPDGDRVYINYNDLIALNEDLDSYLEFKLEELRKKKLR